MKRRGKWWVRLCLLSMAIIALLALPAVHWPLLGWLRGEAFYRGRPTSYWQREVAALEPGSGGFLLSYDELPTAVDPPAPAAPLLSMAWWDAFKDLLGLNRRVSPDELPGWLILYGRSPSAAMALLATPNAESFVDEATLPVKRELLQSDQAFVRWMVLRFLCFHEVNEKYPLFQAALQDANLEVRLEAAFFLRRRTGRTRGDGAPDGLPQIQFEQLTPIFAQGLAHKDPWVQTQCANVLGGRGVAAQAAVPALRAALLKAEKEGSDAKEYIAAALQSIDPAAADKAASK